jgi:hypothetical protein
MTDDEDEVRRWFAFERLQHAYVMRDKRLISDALAEIEGGRSELVERHLQSLIMEAFRSSETEGDALNAWSVAANCIGTDPDLFFTEPGGKVESAKTICSSCYVRNDCLAYALDSGQIFGIWGGLTAPERWALTSVEREVIEANRIIANSPFLRNRLDELRRIREHQDHPSSS